MKQWMLVAVIICSAALFGAAPASAHSELTSSNPPADATLEYAPIGVGLVFNQNINESFATISVVGPDNEQWTQGSTTVDGPDVSVLVKDGIPNGQYTVGYRVTSADGHPITGSYGFTIAAVADGDPSAAPTAPAVAAAATSDSAATSTVSPTYDPDNPSASEGARPPQQNPILLLSIVAIAVLGLGAIALTLALRSKNR